MEVQKLKVRMLIWLRLFAPRPLLTKLLAPTCLGVVLLVALLSLLSVSVPRVTADPAILYVSEGATGDCIGSPCGSVQQAIDLASADDEIRIAGGIYEENLVITHAVALLGGWAGDFSARNLLSFTTTIRAFLDTEHVLRIEETTPATATVRIDGLTLSDGQDGLHIWNGDVTIAQCAVHEVAKQGVEIDGGTVLISATQVMTAQQGIEVDSGIVRIVSGSISNMQQEGLLVEIKDAAPLVTVTHTLIEGCDQQGIQSTEGALWVMSSTIRDVISGAVRIEGGYISLFNNQIHNVTAEGDPGIFITGEDYPVLGAEIVSNVVQSVADHGIYVRDADVVVTANAMQSVGLRGIYARGGAATILSNTIHSTGEDAIHTHVESTAVTIRDNVIADAGDDGIDARGGQVTVVGNHVSKCADNGIKVDQVQTTARVEQNWVLDNITGIALREALDFTVINNIVADHPAGSLELGVEGSGPVRLVEGVVYHNTLVGDGLGQQGRGIRILDPLSATLTNNIVVSHQIGIEADPAATLHIDKTLLWANQSDPVYTGSITIMLPFPPLFRNPVRQDYHLAPAAIAIDRAADVGILTDIDGDSRITSAPPDLGADEFREPSYFYLYLPLILQNHPPPSEGVPRYQIYADPEDLEQLAQDPYLDDTIPATFNYKRGWSVDMRYRGDTSRLMPKKSWKLFFPGADLFQGHEEFNLNADYIDQTLLRSAVGYELFADVGVPSPIAGYARVMMNGEYLGLYSQVEQVDERFLTREDFNIHGNLYKPFYGNLEPPKPWEDNPDWWAYHYPKKTNRKSGYEDIRAFITLINETPDAEFPVAIASTLDVNAWIDWYAVNILLGNFEMLEKNYYLYHDLSADRWHIFPWDVDLAMGHNAGFGSLEALFDTEISWDNPLDSGTYDSPKVDGKWNALIDRMMNVPEFRYFYGRRLIEIMADVFNSDALDPRIDAYFAYIRAAGEADHNRWQPEGFTFSDGPDELKLYVHNRHTWVHMNLPAFMPDHTPPLVLNEMMISNTMILTDEAGDYDPWLELYNTSETLTWDLSGMYLSDDPNHQPKWRIPDGTVLSPQETLLVWADGEPEEGPYHANFVLDPAGGTLDMWDRVVFGNAPIFRETYASQPQDTAYGRLPDGSGSWQALAIPTPGWLNVGRPPQIGEIVQSPTWPQANDPITVMATITEPEGSTITPTLWYRAYPALDDPPAFQSLAMSPVHMAANRNAPGLASVSQCAAVIPGQSQNIWVEYYVAVTDAVGMQTIARPGWPQGDFRAIVGWLPPSVVINEIMALNAQSLEDATGATPDWIELYNSGSTDFDLGGMFITDDPMTPTLHQIPAGIVVPAGGYTILWADDQEGENHLDFKLSGAGEAVGLFDRADRGYAPVDAVYFESQTPDVSWGRFPDGASPWMTMTIPTPGAANRYQPPSFIKVTRNPRWPGSGLSVQVNTMITGGLPIVSTTLWMKSDGEFLALPLLGDGTSYTGTLPAQPTGTMVAYYLELVDAAGQHALYPPDAPVFTERYLVGTIPPPIVINEFLAANDATNPDEFGEYDDWVEIYNGGLIPLSLDDLTLSDDLTDPLKWAFPPGTVIAPREHLLIWCDGDTSQGTLHTNFKLDKDGEALGLFHQDLPLDWLTYGLQQPDRSYGRWSDGADAWVFFDNPTPGQTNE